jgi:hypothetical protein
VPFAGVRVKGARIAGKVDLANTKLIRAIEIVDSKIEGVFTLDHAHTESPITLDGSQIAGDFIASGLHAESNST